MSTPSWQYGPLSSLVYDLDKPVGAPSAAVELYAELLAGVTGEMLEPAVGTGRMLIPLLQRGLRVRGYDLSPHMLARCRENCAARGLDPVLFEADMVGYREAAAFAAVVVPAGSFALVAGRGQGERALRNMYESLTAGGRLIVDVEPLDPAAGPGPMRHWWHGTDLITLTGHAAADGEPGQATGWGRYELWQDGRLVRTELESFPLRVYGLEEFTGLLHRTGFDQVRVHADHHAGRAPTADSQVWTFEAQKGQVGREGEM